MNEDNNKWKYLIKKQQFNDLIMQWNKRINLVSRKKNNVLDLIKDSELYLREIDNSNEVKILDLGTGGGFPGIILAMSLPNAKVLLVDSIQKKINAIKDIIIKLELSNVQAVCSRAEELLIKKKLNLEMFRNLENSFDYVVSRSVAVLQDLCKWSKHLIKTNGKLITIKGGNIKGEISSAKKLFYVKDVNMKPINERYMIIVTFTNL